MATLEQIQARMKKLQAQAEAMVAAKSQSVLNQIRDLMEKYGLTTADLDAHTGGKKRGPKPGAKAAAKSAASAAKYRDPKSGATWTGHGRAPAWIANAKDRSKFLVDSTATTASPAVANKSKTVAKGKGYPRGPQPAKYRDPKTGATWSGRGPAPVWLAGAKDRTKFLIAGAEKSGATATASAKKAAEKTPVAKKAVAKKAVAKKAVAKKAVATKAPAEKSAAKKAVAKKVTAKTSAVAGKKVATKSASTAVKRAATKKVAAKKEAAIVNPAPTASTATPSTSAE